jgi:hypothetical protein
MSLHYKPKIVNDQEGCLLLSTMWNRENPGRSKLYLASRKSSIGGADKILDLE